MPMVYRQEFETTDPDKICTAISAAVDAPKRQKILKDAAPLWSRWRDIMGHCWQVVRYTDAGGVEYRSETGSTLYAEKPMIGWRRVPDEAPTAREKTLEEIAPIGSRWRDLSRWPDPHSGKVYTVRSYAPDGERAHLSAPGDGMLLAHRDWFTQPGRAERVEDAPAKLGKVGVWDLPEAPLTPLPWRPWDDSPPKRANAWTDAAEKFARGVAELAKQAAPSAEPPDATLAEQDPPAAEPTRAHRWNPYLVRRKGGDPMCDLCGLPKSRAVEACAPAPDIDEKRRKHEDHIARCTRKNDEHAARSRELRDRIGPRVEQPPGYQPPLTGRGGAVWAAWEKVPRR